MTFNRRPGPRNNRGRVDTQKLATGGAPPSFSPADIASVTRYFWFRSDLGISAGGGTVSAWADQYALNDAAQASTGSQPTYTASNPAAGNLPTVDLDGVDDFMMVATLDLPIPTVGTPVWFWLVFSQVSWVSTRVLLRSSTSGATAAIMIQQNTAAPGIAQFNGSTANLNNGAPIGTYVRGTVLFTNTAADRILLAGTATTGAASGNRDAAAGNFALGASSVGGLASNVSLLEAICLAGEPTELAQLETYGQARYPFAAFA